MGILDDAIRDHLELKRRHGASEAEVHQQEVEALGSRGRDEPDEDSEAAASAELVDDKAPLDVEAGATDGNGMAAAPEEAAAPETHATEPEPELEHEPAETPEALEDVGPPRELDVPDEPDLPSAPDLQEPEDAASDLDEAPPRGDTPPRGFEAVSEHEDAHADPEPADEEPADEDVLEDTPDFLQETPEHDRLWFEQKPPRDFDFE